MTEERGVYSVAPQPDPQQYAALGEIAAFVRALQERGIELSATNIISDGATTAAIVLPPGYVWRVIDNACLLVYEI